MWSKLLLTTTDICKNFSQGKRRGSKDPKKPTVWSLNQALVSWGLDSNLGGEVSLVSLIPSLRRGKFWNSIPCIAYSALSQRESSSLRRIHDLTFPQRKLCASSLDYNIWHSFRSFFYSISKCCSFQYGTQCLFWQGVPAVSGGSCDGGSTKMGLKSWNCLHLTQLNN